MGAENARHKRLDERDTFFSNAVIPQLHIQIDQAAVNRLRANSHEYVRATVVEGSTVYHDVGIHLKGNQGSFQSLDRKPNLTLNFDKFCRKQRFHGLDKFHLNNSYQDPTSMNEAIGSDVFRAAGLPAARVSHAVVELNGRMLGLYVLVEGFDTGYLKRRFEDASGNLYDGGELTDITQPLERRSGRGPDDRADLKALVEAAREPDPVQRLAKLEKVLDMEAFYSFITLEIMMSSWDGYALHHNNYWLYHDSKTDRLVFLPHGMDQLFTNPQSSVLPDCAGLVAAAVLYAPDGRRRYRERCTMLLSNEFTLDRLTNRVAEIQNRIRPLLTEINLTSAQQHDEAVIRLRERIAQRVVHLERDLHTKPSVLVFDDNGKAILDGWQPQIDFGTAELRQTDESPQCLEIKCTARHVPTIASWRTRVLLPKGRYRLVGKVTAENVTPLPKAPHGGIGLRVFGERSLPQVTSGVQTNWQIVAREFEVDSSLEEKELVCELQAFIGTVRFERSSLVVERIPGGG